MTVPPYHVLCLPTFSPLAVNSANWNYWIKGVCWTIPTNLDGTSQSPKGGNSPYHTPVQGDRHTTIVLWKPDDNWNKHIENMGNGHFNRISEKCDRFNEFWKHLWGLRRDCVFVGSVEAVPGTNLRATNGSVLAITIMAPVLSSQLGSLCFLNCVIIYWYDTMGLGFLWSHRGECCEELLAEFKAHTLEEHCESVKGLPDNHLCSMSLNFFISKYLVPLSSLL